jgi:cell division protein FtsL
MIHRGLLFWSVAAIATACGLFTVKYKVQDLEEKIDRTNQKIIESQQATHILRVEWAHLNEAERIERLALKYLKVEPATIKQVVRLDSLQTADSRMAASKTAEAKTADSQPPRRDPPLPSPPRTGNDVPSSTLPGGGRVAAEAGSPSPASAPPPGRSAGPSTPPRPANQQPATPGPVGEGRSAAVSIDDILSRNEGERR